MERATETWGKSSAPNMVCVPVRPFLRERMPHFVSNRLFRITKSKLPNLWDIVSEHCLPPLLGQKNFLGIVGMVYLNVLLNSAGQMAQIELLEVFERGKFSKSKMPTFFRELSIMSLKFMRL